jgi:hypothetical protein
VGEGKGRGGRGSLITRENRKQGVYCSVALAIYIKKKGFKILYGPDINIYIIILIISEGKRRRIMGNSNIFSPCQNIES